MRDGGVPIEIVDVQARRATNSTIASSFWSAPTSTSHGAATRFPTTGQAGRHPRADGRAIHGQSHIEPKRRIADLRERRWPLRAPCRSFAAISTGPQEPERETSMAAIPNSRDRALPARFRRRVRRRSPAPRQARRRRPLLGAAGADRRDAEGRYRGRTDSRRGHRHCPARQTGGARCLWLARQGGRRRR